MQVSVDMVVVRGGDARETSRCPSSDVLDTIMESLNQGTAVSIWMLVFGSGKINRAWKLILRGKPQCFHFLTQEHGVTFSLL